MKKICFWATIACLFTLVGCDDNSTLDPDYDEFLVKYFDTANEIYYKDSKTATKAIEALGWSVYKTEDDEIEFRSGITGEEATIEFNRDGKVYSIEFEFKNYSRPELDGRMASYERLIYYWGESIYLKNKEYSCYYNYARKDGLLPGSNYINDYYTFLNQFSSYFNSWDEWEVVYTSYNEDKIELEKEIGTTTLSLAQQLAY